METRKNLCAMLPVALHTRVRQEQEKAGMTLGEYVEAMITEYYDWKDGRIMTGEMRTLAAQIPAELFDRLDRYLKARGIKKKDFLFSGGQMSAFELDRSFCACKRSRSRRFRSASVEERPTSN